MNLVHPKTMGCVLAAAAGLLALPVPAAQAVSAATRAAVQRTYQEELAMCGHIQQDRTSCIREAGAARQLALHGQRRGPTPDFSANALARCAVHPPAERTACEARVTGTGDTEVEGSVLGGGLLRETVTTVPVSAAQPMPAAPSGATPRSVAPQPMPRQPAPRTLP